MFFSNVKLGIKINEANNTLLPRFFWTTAFVGTFINKHERIQEHPALE